MKKLLFLTILLILSSLTCFAQENLPTLKSNSSVVSIREGNVLYLNCWGIDSSVKLDEYVVHKFEKEKEISFYSDIDTITFKVTPNKNYDFIILLEGKKVYTRISTEFNKESSNSPLNILKYYHQNPRLSTKTDTIPFVLGKDHRIHIKGTINGSDSLDFLFDTGANAVVLTSSLIGTKVSMDLDEEVKNTGSDGVSIKQKSSNNQLVIKNLVWDSVSITAIDYQNPSFDAVLGWIAFGGKTVEINYDKRILIIYESMPNLSENYSKMETVMLKGIPYMRATLTTREKNSTGWFEYDTGGRKAFYLSQKYAKENELDGTTMNIISTTTFSGSKGVRSKRTIYNLPKLKFGVFETYQIPIYVAEKDPEGVKFNDILGNNLLKRFNAIIDFKNYEIYLKPNKLLHSEY
ncbi:retropepsin-like aspartic protease [Bernardetia sp. OM2101]|uniref:retropepsin-like aspartic protease n=1 Tax=Bernardetia sp. OM2101 TaxID=3344876 RepID=UPI0035CFFFA5